MVRAAVLIPIVDLEPPSVIFIRRAAHLRRNPGQIAFPGGLIDATDGNEAGAALRELQEELGVAPDRVRIVARLPDVITPTGPVCVTPFVGIVRPPLELSIDPGETESVHEVPLAEIYAPGAVHEGIERVERYDVHTWLFDRDGMHVWGATGRMLHHLLVRYPEILTLPLTAGAGPVETAGSALV